MNDKAEQKNGEQTIQIGLAEKHWVVLLAILEETIHRTVMPEIEKLRQRGITLDEVNTTLDEMDDALKTALVGPLVIRGVIVKELTARGIMAPEADESLGIDRLTKAAEDFKKRTAAGGSDQ